MSAFFASGLKLNLPRVTADKPIETMHPPKRAYVPLSPHPGGAAQPLVRIGDRVKTGMQIASGVHAPLSGKVAALRAHPHPVRGYDLTCIIDSDDRDEWEKDCCALRQYDRLGRADILRRLADSGLAGFSETPLEPAAGAREKNATLTVIGCESEPMLTADYRLMIEYPTGVIEGAKILQKLLDCTRLVFVVARNQPQIADLLRREGAAVKMADPRYPVRAEGCGVFDVATCYAAFQALGYSKPLIERIITVAGEGVKEPKNLAVRIGTPLCDIINFCGGFVSRPVRIVFGGPMRGYAQYSYETPVIKSTAGIIVYSKDHIEPETACVRCGRCVDNCPQGLLPRSLFRLPRDGTATAGRGIERCTECGSCAYVCPARRPLVHLIRYAKSEI